ncbi:putative DNA binding domain-containing protein [Candidatus Woesearchaeota archaeon]|nr:putative DNA binding domain-containing protein [Candidatus Woesearchaeota archaeon]
MKESQTVEFKKSLAEINEILETISAFANTKGGKILVGVGENKDGTVKEVVGVTIKGKEIENLTNEIKQNTDPVVFPSVEFVKMAGKEVLSIEVEENESKPVFEKNMVFKRVGKTNKRLSSQEIRKLAKESVDYNYTELICKEATLNDIDEEKVKWFLRKAKAERNFDIEPETPLKEALERLKLMREERLTNAAILLFGKNPQTFFLQAEIRCARFKGIEPLEFIDMKVFGGNIIDQRENAVEFVKEHIKLHAKIVGTERVETWEYPIEAVREAITNALCHRDYQFSCNVQVRIFDDRIEVWGCGLLPNGLSVDDLRKKHDSIPKNPLIAKHFFLIKFIEQWGTGTNRIIKECLSNGLPEPLFEIISNNLVVTLRKYKVTEEEIKNLNERQRQAVKFIGEKGKITSKEYCELAGVVKDTANRDINELLRKGLIKREGTGKKVFYSLK